LLGREEDAADQVAAYVLLHLGGMDARRTVAGVAFMYAQEAKQPSPEMKDFADEHGTPAQRMYNLLCMAYGKDPVLFADVVAKDYLPAERAEGCADEYRLVDFAYSKLIKPYIDTQVRKKRKYKSLLNKD
ncbi:MAG: hypothetical protein HXX19_20200, partial [Rhodoferax sp.]|nr:hypothetical protein [Rhodoferax sp.]